MHAPQEPLVVTSFADELLAALTVHAQPQIAQVLASGLGRPRSYGQPPHVVEGLAVPTGGTVAALIIAGVHRVPVTELPGLLGDPAVKARRDSVRVLVNKSMGGDVRAFKLVWLDALADAVGLDADVMGPVRAAYHRPGELDPDRVTRTVRRLLLARRDAASQGEDVGAREPVGALEPAPGGMSGVAVADRHRPAPDGGTDRAMHAWLRAVVEVAHTPPPWSPDAPVDYPRALDGALATPFAVVLGPSGEGKSRWLATLAAELAQEARATQTWHEHTPDTAPLPLPAAASAVFAQLRRMEARGEDPDAWLALVQVATRPAVGRLAPADLERLRATLVQRVHSGRSVPVPLTVLVDALDELPDRDRRAFTGQGGPLATWHARQGTRVVVVARDAAQAPVHLLPSGVGPSRLRPVRQAQREEYWRRWKGAAAEELVRRSRRDPVVRRLVGSPFLAALAVGSTAASVTRSSLLRDALPRLVTADWNDAPAGAPVGVRVRMAEEIAWRMATDAAGWSVHWPAERVRALILELCGVREDADDAPWLRRGEYEAADAEATALTVLLPGLADGPEGDVSFAHAQLQEFLVARRLARQEVGDAVAFLRERWWHVGRWRDVTVLMAGVLPDPVPLLNALDADGRTDPLGIVDALAVRALAEVPESRRPRLGAPGRVQAVLPGLPQCARDLELLGAGGFGEVAWETLAPWFTQSPRRRREGHEPDVTFAGALRAGAPAALEVLERMADGETAFSSRAMPNRAYDDIVGWDEHPLSDVPDDLVLRLAVAPPHSVLVRGTGPNQLHYQAATEVWLRNLVPLPDSLPPSMSTLLGRGMVSAAVAVLYEIAGQPPPPHPRFDSREYLVTKAIDHAAIPVDVLAEIASDPGAPRLLRELAGIELAKRAPLTARRRVPALLRAVEDPLPLAVALAAAGDHGKEVRKILAERAPRHTGAAKQLLAVDRPAALRAYRALMDATTRHQSAEDGCAHEVLARVCLDLKDVDRELWLEAVLTWFNCPDGTQPRNFVERVLTGVGREDLRRVAVSGRGLRLAAVRSLDGVLDADLLRGFARDEGPWEWQIRTEALKKLGDDAAVPEIVSGLTRRHLETCANEASIPCAKGWFAAVVELAVHRIPADLRQAWHEHTREYGLPAARGESRALDELRRRCDGEPGHGRTRADTDLRKALTRLADQGSADALVELEQRAVGEMRPPAGSGESFASGEWIRAWAARAPERAREALRRAIGAARAMDTGGAGGAESAGGARGEPSEPIRLIKVAADLGDREAMADLIDYGVARRADGRAVTATSPRNGVSDGLVLSETETSAHPVRWLPVGRRDLVVAGFVAQVQVIAERMAAGGDLDMFVAQLRASITDHGHLLSAEEAAGVRERLAVRTSELRVALEFPRTEEQ
ncbi:NACHT domain-containing protein [Streptomyces sp. NPDC017254]|uniref:NACHT domain-containing protein n=1 Tax=unclassified Streptomyces TaxID=2593676 RepID=UPI00378A3BD2